MTTNDLGETMNITEFLEARIQEDEEQAKKCQFLGWFPGKKYGMTTVSYSRVLAECEAKRALLTLFRSGVKFEVGAGDVTGWVSPLTIMALPYRDHPDYQEEWAL